jgi:hypothetical protein
MHQLTGRSAMDQSHVEGREGEVTIDVLAGRPADDPSREQVEDDGEV